MIDKASKSRLRTKFLKIRRKITDKERKTINLNLKLLTILIKKKEKKIAAYFSVRNELDINPLMEFLIKENFIICLPDILKENEKLFFKVWGTKTNLIKGYYGIPVPVTKKTILPDLVLVPLLSFDKKKYRLGYGGGYYDRTLQFLKEKKKIISIGIAYDEQEVMEIPTNKFDVQLDKIVTPTRVLS